MGPQLTRIIASVDPSVRIDPVLRIDEIIGVARRASMFFLFAIALVTGMVLMLATAGTYSLMSFIVSRRTREIGIRKALGASTGGVLRAVFSRALLQLGIGVALGMLPIVVWRDATTTPALLVALPMVLFLAGAVACAVPVRRALRIEPTEALREA
jgi:ABC-type antimicrobial peptide transport system permease subunit